MRQIRTVYPRRLLMLLWCKLERERIFVYRWQCPILSWLWLIIVKRLRVESLKLSGWRNTPAWTLWLSFILPSGSSSSFGNRTKSVKDKMMVTVNKGGRSPACKCCWEDELWTSWKGRALPGEPPTHHHDDNDANDDGGGDDDDCDDDDGDLLERWCFARGRWRWYLRYDHIIRHNIVWHHQYCVISYDTILHMVSFHTIFHMVSFDTIFHMVSYDTIFHMVS